MFGGTVRGKLTTLRLPVDADLDLHQRWSADMRVRRAGPIGRWHEPAATATWKERWTEEAKDRSSVLWSIAAGDETVGYVRIAFEGGPRASEVVGIDQFMIDPEQQRKGYGFDAALALHRWIFDYANVRMAATDRIAADDLGRQRILERLGHERFGHGHSVYYRDGAYVDQYLYQLERDAWLERWPDEREYAPLGDETTP
jgi:RimJ/RimL family protein N-acetyltransferase